MPSGSRSRGGLGAIVLCGGKSSRMGRSKAWLPFPSAEGGKEEALLSRIVRRLRPAVDRVVVVAAVGQALPPLPVEATVVRDPSPDGGPLVAALAGLRALEGIVQDAFVTTTDAPFVSAALVRRLAALRTDPWEAAAPHVDGRWQPLTSVYEVATADVAERLVAEGVRRSTALLEAVQARAADRETLLADPQLGAEDPDLWCLLNVNTADQYQEALRRARPVGDE